MRSATVRKAQPTIAGEVERFLSTGDSDPYHGPWSGGFLDRAQAARNDLRAALVSAVRQRTEGLADLSLPEADPVSLTHAKVEPMVRGLFPRTEQDVVLAMLERSVVFLTSANIEPVLVECAFDGTAWTLANLYLASLDAELLGEHAPRLVGLSEETTCYVSAEYFTQDDPFADFIVHEVAHVFHNCKRATIGLRETRKTEWLLDIDYRKRESFAYSCEAFARILEHGKTRAERRMLADKYAEGSATSITDERVDPAEVASIVRDAVEAQNGWKAILERCAAFRRRVRRSGQD